MGRPSDGGQSVALASRRVGYWLDVVHAPLARANGRLMAALDHKRADRDRVNGFLNELASWDVRLDEAQDELALGFAADDIPLVIAAAKRIESLGALMGERCRAWQRRSA